MPCVQFQCQEVDCFEKYFQLAVEQRIERPCESLLDAYLSYQNFGEQQRLHFWDFISQRTQITRERIYKFFRFTWSRKFYEPLMEHRDVIRGIVFKLLSDMKLTEKTPDLNQVIWNKVWDIFRHYNLHYDGTDQFVRNSVNLYFVKLATGCPIDVPNKIVLKPLPTDKQLAKSTSRPKCQINEGPQDPPAKPIQRVPYEDNYQYFGMELLDQPHLTLIGDIDYSSQERDEDVSADSNVEPTEQLNVYECLKESVLGVVSQGKFQSRVEETVVPDWQAEPIDWDAL